MTPTLSSLPSRVHVAHFFVRRLRLERHLVAGERQDLLGRAGRRARRQHLQPHGRARLAANELHDIIEAPADDVGELALEALADADDAVVGVERRRPRRRGRLR